MRSETKATEKIALNPHQIFFILLEGTRIIDVADAFLDLKSCKIIQFYRLDDEPRHKIKAT